MNSRGGRGPALGGSGRGVAGSKKSTSKIPDFRAEFLRPLPSQVLRPLYAASDGRRTARSRLAAHAQASKALRLYAKHMAIWNEGVDDSMQRHGADRVDRSDEGECQAFLAAVGLSTLERRHIRETAIEAAKLQLELVARDLAGL